MNFIDIHLDTVKKYRNASEYRPVGRARWNDIEEVGDGYIIKSLCRRIAAENPQISGHVRVFRGDMLCFEPSPLKTWLRRNPFSSGKEPPALKAARENK